jgi:hypothetical protein
MSIQIAKHIDYIDHHMGEEIISSGDKMRHSAFEWLELSEFVVAIDSEIGRTSDPSALSGFISALRSAGGLSVEETVDEMAAGAASSDMGTVGRLLGLRDVNAITFGENELPESVVRRPLKCSLLGVTVGSGSVEMTKYLLEFHRANPTRETLKQSISSGNLELFKMMRERLPEAGQKHVSI